MPSVVRICKHDRPVALHRGHADAGRCSEEREQRQRGRVDRRRRTGLKVVWRSYASSTAEVDFWASRDVREVVKSHVNDVVADTARWEQSAASILITAEVHRFEGTIARSTSTPGTASWRCSGRPSRMRTHGRHADADIAVIGRPWPGTARAEPSGLSPATCQRLALSRA
jgi:hypothetical protein